MITLFYVAILIFLIFAPVLLIGLYDYRQTLKARKQLAAYFDTAVAAHGLQVSSTEILPRTLLGMDARQRQMLVVTRGDEGRNYCRIISLDEIDRCTYRQDNWQAHTSAVFPSRNKHKVGRVYLQLQSLLWPLVELEFYDRSAERPGQLMPAQLKAKQWESLIMQLKGAGTATPGIAEGGNRGMWLPLLAMGTNLLGELPPGLAGMV